MTGPHSNWPPWLPSWPGTSQHPNEIEARITRLEVSREQQEDVNEQMSDRMKWLERGLQSLAVIVLAILTKQAPSSAAGLADVLLAIIKR